MGKTTEEVTIPDMEVAVEWVVENLGGSFIDDIPDYFDDVENHEAILRFSGSGTLETWDDDIELLVTFPDGTSAVTTSSKLIPHNSFLDVKSGVLTVKHPDGRIVRRSFNQDDEHPDWEELDNES